MYRTILVVFTTGLLFGSNIAWTKEALDMGRGDAACLQKCKALAAHCRGELNAICAHDDRACISAHLSDPKARAIMERCRAQVMGCARKC